MKRRADRSTFAAFFAASAALFIVFLAAGVPIPLYGVYRSENGITDSQLTTATVVYLVATAAALLFLGRLSNHLGRRPVAVAAVVAALAGSLTLTGVDSLSPLLIGRLFQGLACGVATSAIGSLIVDTAPPRPTWLPALVTSTMPPAAVPLGAIFSGLLTSASSGSRVLSLSVVSICLGAAALALLRWAPRPERRAGVLASLWPRVTLPRSSAPVVLAVSAAFLAVWSVGSFYQAFAPAMAQRLHAEQPLSVSIIFASIVVLSPVGGAVAGKLAATTSVWLGLTGFVLAYGGALAFLWVGSPAGFIAASLFGGIASGAAASGTMRILLGSATPEERAGTLAASYLICYTSAAIPSLIAGQLTAIADVRAIGSGYAVLAAAAAAIAFIAIGRAAKLSRRPSQRTRSRRVEAADNARTGPTD